MAITRADPERPRRQCCAVHIMASLPQGAWLVIIALTVIGVIVMFAWVSLAWLLSYSN